MLIEEQMRVLAEQFNVEPTEYLPKIAKAREMMKCSLTKCICEPNNPERFCISETCLAEIMTNGICHCKCYKLKGE